MIKPKKEFMLAVIEEAIKSREKGDYAVGAAIANDSKIVARAGHRTILDEDSTKHAEIVAIQKASGVLGTRYLEDCVLYSTHEPCPMCAAAAVWARMRGIVFGATNQDMIEWKWRIIDIPASKVLQKASSPKLFIVKGFLREECKKLFHT